MRALGFEPRKEEIKKMVSEVLDNTFEIQISIKCYRQVDKDNSGRLSLDAFMQLMANKMAEKDTKEEIMKVYHQIYQIQTSSEWAVKSLSSMKLHRVRTCLIRHSNSLTMMRRARSRSPTWGELPRNLGKTSQMRSSRYLLSAMPAITYPWSQSDLVSATFEIWKAEPYRTLPDHVDGPPWRPWSPWQSWQLWPPWPIIEN